ncbi:predicted protein [Nematostella vectensis]|uniref:Enoyl-CoA delta isomerase 1, mitochondrial n=1 Tax=Nematostella vectensis TaxID=45351 RepID=A7RUI0_NEMVE|nr:predicted protein [Nematostella vectensis]|eukprot:XP_001636919.1 predicted protein [Nematostella vectensis]
MTLSRKPVNSFSLEFLEEIHDTLEDLESNTDCRGLIVTSSMPKVFSAGLDLVKELYKSDEKRLFVFWRRFQDVWMQLYGSRLATVAAVNGHAVAGGCLLAAACDYRLMAANFTIGMNETIVGIAIPFWISQNIVNLVGTSTGERICALGTMLSAEAAQKIGLVDHVVPQEKLMAEAQIEINKWLLVPESGRALTKQVLRRDLIQRLHSLKDEDAKNFAKYILQDNTQKLLEQQIKKMTKK